MPTTPDHTSIIALDVGDKRVGIAVASLAARLPRPLTTLQRGESFIEELGTIIKNEGAGVIVIGLPRGLDGQRTAQTAATEQLTEEVRQTFGLPVHFQDEALTSRKAEHELEARGKDYTRADIDALAATYILEDFLAGYNGEAA